MPQPFNYALNVVDPVAALQNGMAFGQNQRANEQAMVMNDQSMALRDSAEQRAQTAFQQQNVLFDQGQQDRAEAQRKAQEVQADLLGLSEKIATGDYSSADFAAIAAKHPDLVDEMSKMWDGANAERKQNDVAELFKGVTAIKAGRPDLAIQMLEDRAVAAENSGDQMEADIARATAAAIKADPAAGLTSLGLLLQAVDPDAAVSVFGEGRRVQSTNAYANGTTVTVFSDGSKEVTDAAGNVFTGQAAIDAAKAAMDSEAEQRRANAEGATGGRLTTTADLGDEAAAAEARGAVIGKAQGEAITNEGDANADAQRFIDLIEQVEKDPALPSVLGNVQGRLPAGIPFITGGQAGADIGVKLEQLTGQAFIAAYNNIRGAGAITEQEGRAATAAEQRLNRAQSEKEYRAALAEAKKLLRERMDRASKKAAEAQSIGGGGSGSPEAPPAGEKSLDDLLKEAEGL